MTDKIDPSTLTGTELILRQRHCPDTIAVSPSEAATEGVTKQEPSVGEEASEEAVIAFKAALELLEIKARADKLIELAKSAKKRI